MTISDSRSIARRKPLARRVLLAAVVLMLAGCAPSHYDREGNPQELSQRDGERDYMECEYKARLANENQFYNQRTPFPFGPASKARATTRAHCTGSRPSMRCGIPVWQPKATESSRRMVKNASGFVLASFRPSTYPEGTPRAFTRCGLAGRPF